VRVRPPRRRDWKRLLRIRPVYNGGGGGRPGDDDRHGADGVDWAKVAEQNAAAGPRGDRRIATCLPP